MSFSFPRTKSKAFRRRRKPRVFVPKKTSRRTKNFQFFGVHGNEISGIPKALLFVESQKLRFCAKRKEYSSSKKLNVFSAEQ